MWEVEALPGWELDRWRAYHAVEPLPDAHWDAAQTCATIINSQRVKGRPSTADDFLPRLVEPKKARRNQSPEEMAAVMARAVEASKLREMRSR